MRITLKQLFALVGGTAVLSLIVMWALQSRASDFWGYGKLGVTDGRPSSAVYYLEVRGVGSRPTIARIVRLRDSSLAPENALEISHKVKSELDSHTRNADRWNPQCILIAGRTNEEKVPIPIDVEVAKELFERPGTQFDDYETFEKLWTDRVALRLPPNGEP